MGKIVPTTNDQKIYQVDGKWKAEIDIDLAEEDGDSPSIKTCRHAILTINNKDAYGNDAIGYVVYDRLLSRIVNGVFYDDLNGALRVAGLYNKDPESPQDMAPNGLALGLIYPPSE